MAMCIFDASDAVAGEADALYVIIVDGSSVLGFP
jgi:hypothetical protein